MNKINAVGWALVLLGIAGLLNAISDFIGSEMQSSLVEATNMLVECERSGKLDCHIEKDGLSYNVYFKER